MSLHCFPHVFNKHESFATWKSQTRIISLSELYTEMSISFKPDVTLLDSDDSDMFDEAQVLFFPDKISIFIHESSPKVSSHFEVGWISAA